MNNTKTVLLSVGILCFALLGFALYMQHAHDYMPCPLCVLQRYAFTALGAVCLVSAFLRPGAARIGNGLGLLAALTGAGIAGYHVWVKAHPSVSCGIDPLETALNRIPPAKLLPQVFRADGFCTAEYPPLLGLSFPQWSLIWFALFAIALGWTLFRRQAR